MKDGVIAIAAVAAMLMIAGGALGLLRRDQFSFRWLLVAVGLLVLDDFLLTRGYGLIPKLLPAAGWNWQGKAMALVATLIVASLPAFGWRRIGLTLAQNRKGWRVTAIVALVTCAVFIALALHFPNDTLDRETLAFQLTMPGFEEEPYYRGALLLALNEAFRGRMRVLGIDLGWGGLLTCVLFGLGHAFNYSHGTFSFDWMTFALTGVPSFILVWMRERTGSLMLPVLLHNFANSISLLI